MIRIFLFILSLTFVQLLGAQSTAPKGASIVDSLLQMEKILSANEDVNESAATAVSYLNTVEDLHKLFPAHPRCPEFLFRAGDVAVGLKKYERALAFWTLLMQDYEGHVLRGRAYFFTAFVLDSKVGDKEAALKAYDLFIQTFPDHELIGTAKMLRQQVSVSEERLIETIKQKN